jgi:hypothetical protein
MMRRKHATASKPGSAVIDGALDAIGAEELRELVRDVILWLDEKTHARLHILWIATPPRRSYILLLFPFLGTMTLRQIPGRSSPKRADVLTFASLACPGDQQGEASKAVEERLQR